MLSNVRDEMIKNRKNKQCCKVIREHKWTWYWKHWRRALGSSQ